MKENSKNRAIYEECFTGWHSVPDIDERDGTFTKDDNGVMIPATPLFASDYITSKKVGLKHLFESAEIPVKTLDELYNMTREDNLFMMYDCIHIKERDMDVAVCYADENNLYVVDGDNNMYSIAFLDSDPVELILEDDIVISDIEDEEGHEDKEKFLKEDDGEVLVPEAFLNHTVGESKEWQRGFKYALDLMKDVLGHAESLEDVKQFWKDVYPE